MAVMYKGIPAHRTPIRRGRDMVVHAPTQKFVCERNQTLYLSGDSARSLFRVANGLVRVARTTPDGNAVTVRHAVPGDIFGEEAMVGATRAGTAEALTEAELEVIDPTYLDASDTAVIMDSLSLQLQRLMDFAYHLQTGSVRQRVSRYLVWLAGTSLAVGDSDRVAVAVTHELLAEGTASTRESVSKIITELRSDGLIESGYRSIVLTDPQGLEMAAEGL